MASRLGPALTQAGLPEPKGAMADRRGALQRMNSAGGGRRAPAGSPPDRPTSAAAAVALSREASHVAVVREARRRAGRTGHTDRKGSPVMTMGDRIHPRRARTAGGAVNSAADSPAGAAPAGRARAVVAPRERQVENPDQVAAPRAEAAARAPDQVG
jgi:hypothetical protein